MPRAPVAERLPSSAARSASEVTAPQGLDPPMSAHPCLLQTLFQQSRDLRPLFLNRHITGNPQIIMFRELDMPISRNLFFPTYVVHG